MNRSARQGGFTYVNGDNALSLKCHAGNTGGTVAAFSTPLVFRLAQHDTHCDLRTKNLSSGDSTHWVNRNSDAVSLPICLACHQQPLDTGNMPWAVDWTSTNNNNNCTACHEHQNNPAPPITCK